MDTYGKRLAIALASLNRVDRDRAWLAGRVGISVSALSQVILGKTKAFTAENHEAAVKALGCSGQWLATGEGSMIPIIANMSATIRGAGGISATGTLTDAPSATIEGSKAPITRAAEELARLYDLIPESDQIRRAVAYAAVMTALIPVVEKHKPVAKQEQPADQKKQSA